MKCFRCFSFALFALLGVFFGSFIINQSDTYALDDLSYTLDSSNSSEFFYFCSDSDSSFPNCSGYSYILISLNSSCPTSPYTYYEFQYGYNNGPYPISIRSYSNAFSLFYVPSFSTFFHRSFSLSSGCEISVRLSENNPYASGIIPSGSIELTENGTYDVSQYAEAVVNVPETDCPSSSGGDYHEDLVAINNSIMICAATCLVIYFFYCIYRMIIKNSGVK